MPDSASSVISACIVFGIILAGIAVVCAWAIVKFFLEASFDITDWQDWAGIILLIAIVLGTTVGSIKLFCQIPVQSKMRETIVYATIDDTVSWLEVNEKYELIRQDGKIY